MPTRLVEANSEVQAGIIYQKIEKYFGAPQDIEWAIVSLLIFEAI